MKLWNYMFMITGISLVLAMAGIDVAGLTDLFKMIGLTTNNTGVATFAVENTLWNKIFGVEGLLVAIGTSGAIGIGTFIYTKDKSFLMVPLITGVSFYWGSIMVSLVQQKGDYAVFGTILAMIWIALTVGFIQSCVDYFMGVD
jgi:hypothetical protein